MITWSSRATTYYRSYNRALLKYVNNGFFARDLDADDVAFIEQIRERGCVPCGSLAHLTPTNCTHSDDVVHRSALIEEMDFWRSPYAIDKEIVRRSGPVMRKPRPVPGTTPHAEQLRKNRELLAAAQAEEHQRLVHKQLEQLRRDIEWERASAPFGSVVDRHYVPQWKLDEHAEAKAAKREAKLAAKKWAEEARELKRAKKMQRDEDRRILAENREALKRAHQQVLAKETLERLQHDALQQQERHRILAEHRATLERLRQIVPHPAPIEPLKPWEQELISARQREYVKGRIVAILRDAFPNMVTLDALRMAMPDVDSKLVMQCAEEMAGNGTIKKAAA
jgi:hypothetical protein